MPKGYKLKSTISSQSAADPDDIWLLKNALRQDGSYTEPTKDVSPFPDSGLFEAIKRFQRKKGLRVDGVVKPGGETERELQQHLHAVAKFRCILCKAWHGGLYSPSICWQCWHKAAS